MLLRKSLGLLGALLLPLSAAHAAETFAEVAARVGQETQAALEASPFRFLSSNYFERFRRDPAAKPAENEVAITEAWSLTLPADPSESTERMAGHLREFLASVMDVELASSGEAKIVLTETGLDAAEPEGSFAISVAKNKVTVTGRDAAGLRDGIVKLVDRMGFREAPILEIGEEVYRPRLEVRLGTTPSGGSFRELVFMGYNAVFSGGGSIYALSRSDAIPELAYRRVDGMLENNRAAAAEARAYGLKTFAFLDARQKFPEDHPVFEAHPEIRGARTWQADGEFVLCTEHPLVKQWLRESITGIFKADPDISALVLIIGGEGFYHCYMRPYGVEKGHTNCERCEALDAETVVANLVNLLAEAARSVQPKAEVVIWPYSAEHVWSADRTQEKLIEKLKPGVALLTEIEKDEYVEKPGGVRKHLWDYSIDLIGPGDRAAKQIAACEKAGINVYLKSEPELGFEAARLPQIPSMDRWVDRAEALASCGATGAFVFPAFRPNYGTSAAEVAKYFWWSPVPDQEAFLEQFAARWAGDEAGPHLREAWRHVSEAIPLSPVIPPYYKGPQYLGPAHPMIANPEAELPEVFYGYYLFLAEIKDSEGQQTRPTFETSPFGDDVPTLTDYYRRMEAELKKAVEALEKAEPLVPESHQILFEAEAIPTEWFYRTTRTTANFYEACQLRDKLLAYVDGGNAEMPLEERKAAYNRWRAILEDERENTMAALPLVERDMRLDFYYGSDHTFPHAAEMIRAKLEILDRELQSFLPAVAESCGI